MGSELRPQVPRHALFVTSFTRYARPLDHGLQLTMRSYQAGCTGRLSSPARRMPDAALKSHPPVAPATDNSATYSTH